MKIRNFLAALAMVLLVGGATVATIPQTASALTSCSSGSAFLTIPAWYDGLTVLDANDECVVNQEMPPKTFVLKIIGNIVEIILQIVGYVSMGFIIYGGFLYMIATGDSGKLAGAKSTILNAVIGLVIAIFSVAIVNFITESIK